MIRLFLFIFGISLAISSFAGKISRTKKVNLNIQKGVTLLDVNFDDKRDKDGVLSNDGKLLIQKNAGDNPTWVTLLDVKFLDKKKTKMLALVLFPNGHLECIETQDTNKAQEEDDLPKKLETEKIFQCSKCHVELAKFPACFEGDPFEYWQKRNGEFCPCCENELEFEEVVKK